MKCRYTLPLLIAVAGLTAQAQGQTLSHLLLVAPTVSGHLNDPITFDIVATGDVQGAVAWGTVVSLSDPLKMTYQSNNGASYRSLQPYFDFDLSDTSQGGNGVLGLNFLNSAPGSHLGTFGYVPLAEFQVLLSGRPSNSFFTIGLSPLGAPPVGSAVEDDSGNNLLSPTNPSRPNDPVATAYVTVSLNGFWVLSGAPPLSVPEPSSWITLGVGLASAYGLLKRRRRA